jgi:hypothetical protein
MNIYFVFPISLFLQCNENPLLPNHMLRIDSIPLVLKQATAFILEKTLLKLLG